MFENRVVCTLKGKEFLTHIKEEIKSIGNKIMDIFVFIKDLIKQNDGSRTCFYSQKRITFQTLKSNRNFKYYLLCKIFSKKNQNYLHHLKQRNLK